MKPTRMPGFIILAAVLALTACSYLKPPEKLPAMHPEKLARVNPICTGCHDQNGPVVYADFDHRRDWATLHGRAAWGQDRVCSLCHRQDYCNDCHGARTELKPSIRRQGDVGRNLIHRGDYISRHRIDGRTDPSSCFNCHGNPKRDRTCAPCHG